MERKSYIFEMVLRKQSIRLLAQKVRTSKEIQLEVHTCSAVVSNRQFQILFDHF